MKKITVPDDELLDLVNDKDEVIGTVWKSEAHNDPTKIHREVAIVVFNTFGETLIQQRSRFKSSPLAWKLTAAGHIGAGEDPKDAIKREVFEELGLKVNPNYVNKIFYKTIGKGTDEARFNYTYYTVVEGRPNLRLDKKEVENVRWIKPEDLETFSRTNNWDIKGLSHKIIMEIYKKIFLNK